MILTIALIFILYLLPGYSFSLLFSGKLRRSPFFYLFLSFLIIPFLYSFLVSFKILNFTNFIIAETCFVFLCLHFSKKIGVLSKINLDNIAPPFKISRLTILLGVSFFILIMSLRLGLWKGYFPVGDDQHQIRKIVSIVESPNEPLFYHFPTTRLTIYYFNNVAPGLLTKFSGNFVKANQAWFIHVALQTALILWLIVLFGGSLLKNNTQRLIFLFGLTYFSGLEFYLYKFIGPGFVDQLEWWSDWFFPQSKIHMQISNPFNLFFWVPQHLMAALFVLVIYLFLRSKEKNKALSIFFLSLLWSSILGNSAFVFISSVLVYCVYSLIEFIKSRDLAAIVRFNLPIVILSVILSAKNLELFLTAEKGHYFVPMFNVFWFVSNSNLWGKIINLSISVPLYLLVEFGFLFFVLIYCLIKFVKDRDFREKYLFLYLFIFMLPVIFFVKSLDDDNISMRSFIPVQIALAIFLAEFVGEVLKSRPKAIIGIVVLLVLSLPSGLYDFGLSFNKEYQPLRGQNYEFYKWIDRNLPLNSIVFTPYYYADNLTALGHRFTFKDPSLFSATDSEHTARGKVRSYEGRNFAQAENIYRVLTENKELLKRYHLYSMPRFGT